MKSIKASNLGIGFFSCIALVGFIATIVFFFIHLESKEDSIHPFNTAYLFGGAISGAFSCLSLLGILWTLKKQTEANEKQDKRLEKQQFETTFFNMMSLFQQIVTEIQIYPFNTTYVLKGSNKTEPLSSVIGRESFRVAYDSAQMTLPTKEYYEQYKKVEDHDVFEKLGLNNDLITSYKGLKDIIKHFGLKAYPSVKEITAFDHYFRYLYRIMKFVDEATFLEENENAIRERYKYISILRGTLSRDELLWLFYNGLFFDKLKDLMEKYTLLKNIREDLTVESLEVKESTDMEDAPKKVDYYLLLTDSIKISDSHKPKRAEDIEVIIPKYYIGAFLNEKELSEKGLYIKQ